MKISVPAVVLLAACAGCAGNLLKPVSFAPGEKAKIRQSRPIVVTMQETPGFMFNTPSGALVDAGMARWREPGNAPTWSRITEAHNVPDFTESVRNKFVADLKRQGGGYTFARPPAEREPFSYDENTAYVTKYNTDYVMEFRTQNGTFHYGPLSWKTYHMSYFGQARIIRTADQAVVWKANCSIKSSDNPLLEVPVEDFLADEGRRLRDAASYVTTECARQLLKSFNASGPA